MTSDRSHPSSKGYSSWDYSIRMVAKMVAVVVVVQKLVTVVGAEKKLAPDLPLKLVVLGPKLKVSFRHLRKLEETPLTGHS